MTHAADLAFMLVYIAWPSIAKACFQLFRCRMFENQISLLEADLADPAHFHNPSFHSDLNRFQEIQAKLEVLQSRLERRLGQIQNG